MKDFQQLINAGIIGKIFFNTTPIHHVWDLIDRKLITQIGVYEWVKRWWDSPESNLPQEPIYEIHKEPINNATPPLYPNRVLLFLKEITEDNNIYDEYIWQNGQYEKIGQFSIADDLLPYITFEDLRKISDYLDRLRTTINNNYKTHKNIRSNLNGKTFDVDYNSAENSLDFTEININVDVPTEDNILISTPPLILIK